MRPAIPTTPISPVSQPQSGAIGNVVRGSATNNTQTETGQQKLDISPYRSNYQSYAPGNAFGQQQIKQGFAEQERWNNMSRESLGLGAGAGTSKGGGIAVGAGSVFQGPVIPMPQWQAPAQPGLTEYKAPSYAPPGEDKSVYGKERAMQAGVGARQLQRGVDQAMSTMTNIDNPAERERLMRATFEGMGRGLEQVAQGSHQRATQVAGKARTEQLQIYQSQYAAQSEESKVNWQQQVNQKLESYMQQLFGARSQYEQQLAMFQTQPLDVQRKEMDKAIKTPRR
jgi:hypothetical protein